MLCFPLILHVTRLPLIWLSVLLLWWPHFFFHSWGDESLSHQKAELHRKQDNKKNKEMLLRQVFEEVKYFIYHNGSDCLKWVQTTVGSLHPGSHRMMLPVGTSCREREGGGQCTYCNSGLMPDACYNMHPWCCRHVCFCFFFWEETSKPGHHQNGLHFL